MVVAAVRRTHIEQVNKIQNNYRFDILFFSFLFSLSLSLSHFKF